MPKTTKAEPVVSVSIRFPRSLHKKLAEKAQTEGRSFNQAVIRQLQESLTHQKAIDGLDQQVKENEKKVDQVLRAVADIQALIPGLIPGLIAELQTKVGGKPRPRRARAVTVANVAEQPAGANT